ncbi:MAG: biotin/lipoyl-containing protein, partial [Gemmatimonadales bacterium]
MATKVFMEALSPTMEEGRVVKWLKREGDPVTSGETLAEVETDKAVMDLIARADGVLRQVAVAEGQTVPVGNVVAIIAEPGEALEAAPATASRQAPAAAAGSGERGAVPSGAARVATPAAPADATRVRASPLAKRMAREAGLDLKLVTGSGPGGRVVRRDLEPASASRERGAVPSAAMPAPGPEVPLPAPRSPVVVPGGAVYEDVPLTQIRKTIAKRLVTSLGPVPHFFLTTEVDMERAAE